MKIAINKNIINKIDGDDKILWKKSGETFTNLDINPKQFVDFINKGFPFCSQHEGNRSGKNFICSDILTVDIDDGMTVNEALSDDYINKYGLLIYTTPSHTENFQRFRIVFKLNTTITDSKKMRAAFNGAIRKFGGDPRCKDVCRLFFGSKGSNPILIGNVLPDEELEKLIVLGEESYNQSDRRQNDHKQNIQRTTIQSKYNLDKNTIVHDSNGVSHKLIDMNEGVSIHCPVHIDNNPSAFTVKSRNGGIGVHCSSKCNSTFWINNGTPYFNFDYNVDKLNTLEQEVFFDKEPAFLRINKEYLGSINITTNFTFIKSPKGTGKTFFLEKVVKDCKIKVKNKKKVIPKSVLLIGHRRSLISSIAKRLKLDSYFYTKHINVTKLKKGQNKYNLNFEDNDNDVDTVERISFRKPTSYFATSVDSLINLNPEKHKYDVVIIDEVEQVLSHLTGDTIKENRNRCYLTFKHYIDVAEKVIVTDADLNELTVNTMWDFTTNTCKSARYIVNQYQSTNGKVELYENKNHLKMDLFLSIKNNKKCFVSSNSKTQLIELEKSIKNTFMDIKVFIITSKNSEDYETQYFISNIKDEIRKYDVILASPSLGTGVDISFPEKEKVIDYVYGIFESRINTHFDIDQQISRVRHPKNVRVWVSPEKHFFETNTDVIKREILAGDKEMNKLIRINQDGTFVFESNNEYVTLYTNVLSIQRGSKNSLKHHFIELKKHYGWDIQEIKCDDDLSISGRTIAKLGKEIQEEERKESILSAKNITRKEYQDLMKKNNNYTLNADESCAMRRYEMESFYLKPISSELLDSDNNGKYRNQIRNMGLYLSTNTELKTLDQIEMKKNISTPDRSNYFLSKQIINDILKSCGLANSNTSIKRNAVISNRTMGEFISYCNKNKTRVGVFFNIDIRKDIHKKPIQTLSRFLGLIGLKLEKVQPLKTETGKVNQYRLNPKQYNDIIKLIEYRKKNNGKWNKMRDKSRKNRLFTKKNPMFLPEFLEDMSNSSGYTKYEWVSR